MRFHFVRSVEAMKPENSVPSAANTAAGGQVWMKAGTGSEERLKLTMEAPSFRGALVLHCQAELIFHSEARSLSGVITEALPTARRMVVDLAGVLSLDSAALGELVLTHMWAEAAGLTLKFACPSSSLRRLLESTNLISVLEVYASVAEAMSAIREEQILTS
jgi:anti-anti-sigma factor